MDGCVLHPPRMADDMHRWKYLYLYRHRVGIDVMDDMILLGHANKVHLSTALVCFWRFTWPLA